METQNNIKKEDEKMKTILIRFNQNEWELVENVRKQFGVRTRGDVLRFLLLPKLREISNG